MDQPSPDSFLDDLVGAPLAVLKRKPNQCGWPIGAPGSPDFRFCLEPKPSHPDIPYCDEHRKRAGPYGGPKGSA